jgi:hypothetical protein
MSDHIWGSPATCREKLREVNDRMGTNDSIAVFSYGSMPVEKAEKSMLGPQSQLSGYSLSDYCFQTNNI